MNLSQLLYFQIVAEEEHISRAADKLHISQPSLSTTIRHLEEELEVTLFERRGRNIYLNASGQRLLEHTYYIFSQLDALQTAFDQIDFNLEHGLSMAVNNSTFLDSWLADFIITNNKTRITQTTMSETQMIDALLREEIDVALGSFSDIPTEIDHHTLLEDEYMVVVPTNHPLAKKTKLYFEDIRYEPFAALPSNGVNCFIHHIFRQKNALPNIVFEGHHRMMIKMLMKNHALFFATRQIAYIEQSPNNEAKYFDQEDGFSQLRVLPIVDLNTRFQLSVCWKKDRPLPIMARKLIAALVHDYQKYENSINKG